MTMCKICGGKSHNKYTITKFSVPFDIYECGNCQTLFQYPQPKTEFYNEDYYAGRSEYSYIDERDDKIIRDMELSRRLSNIVKIFLQKIDSVKLESKIRLLDIGSAYNALVNKASGMGMEAVGYDISPASPGVKIDICKQHSDDKFHIVTMIETMEHLSDPNRAIRNINLSMESGGLLVIQTANFHSIVRLLEGKNSRYFLPGHNFYFNRRSLCGILKSHGFEIVKVHYKHETGLVPALVRKILTNRGRHPGPDMWIVFITVVLHMLSQVNIVWPVNGGMVIYARKK